jgi:hypothetical protein
MDYLIVVEKQLRYAKNIMLGRKEQFQESFENSLFEGEKTATEVYLHGLNPLYKSCMKILDPKIDDSLLELEFNNDLPLHEQYIDLYEQVLKILRELKVKIDIKIRMDWSQYYARCNTYRTGITITITIYSSQIIK